MYIASLFYLELLLILLLQLPDLILGRQIKPRTLGRITQILDKLHHSGIPQDEEETVKVGMQRQQRSVVFLVVGVKISVRELRFIEFELNAAHTDCWFRPGRMLRLAIGFRDRFRCRFFAVRNGFSELGGLAGLVDCRVVSSLRRRDIALHGVSTFLPDVS
jgi:hypothetical protein